MVADCSTVFNFPRRARVNAMPLASPLCFLLSRLAIASTLLHFAVIALVVSGLKASAEETPAPSVTEVSADRHPELTRLSPTEEVWIDAKAKEVLVGGKIAIDKGPIEFFACPKDTKEHESIVAVRSSARLIHTALLAIGLQPGKPVAFDPAYVPASGAVVRVTMRWIDAKQVTQEARAQDWIRNTKTGKATEEEWVFAGSSLWTDSTTGKDYYQADGGDLICVSNFPTAMLDLPVKSSQSNQALLFEAFEERVPPHDTEVEIIFSAGKK